MLVEEKEKQYIQLKSIKIGDSFKIGGQIYIKIQKVSTKLDGYPSKDANCVNLTTGSLVCHNEQEVVHSVNSYRVVEV